MIEMDSSDYERIKINYIRKGYRPVTTINNSGNVKVETTNFREINEQDTKGLVALLTDGKHGEMPTGQDKKDLTEYIRNRL